MLEIETSQQRDPNLGRTSAKARQSQTNSPLRALLVQHTAGAVRARDKGVLAEGDAAAAVAAQVAHDGAGLVGVARAAALGSGRTGRDLVLFARHSWICGIAREGRWGGRTVLGWRWWRVAEGGKECLVMDGGGGEYFRQNFKGGEGCGISRRVSGTVTCTHPGVEGELEKPISRGIGDDPFRFGVIV